jgi:hypothetical protein
MELRAYQGTDRYFGPVGSFVATRIEVSLACETCDASSILIRLLSSKPNQWSPVAKHRMPTRSVLKVAANAARLAGNQTDPPRG